VNLQGTTLHDRYFLRQWIGSGGMSEVYLAWDRMRSVDIAVKVLRQDLDDPERFYQAFTEEAEFLRQLDHPNVVRLYEVGRDGETVFFVMDWIEGSDLKKIIRSHKKPFMPEEISPILTPVCSALNYAHQKNIIHCDVKPGNVMLRVDGHVFLTDFGVAQLARDHKAGGTPAYMAPEQFGHGRVDARTDIYGLGIMLFEMLSGGKKPFAGKSPDSKGSTERERIEWEHLYQTPPSLSIYNPKINLQIEEVILKALDKDPAKRYLSVLALSESFELACRGWDDRTSVVRMPKAVLPPKPKPPKIAPPPVKPISQVPLKAKAPFLLGLTGEFTGQTFAIPKAGLTIGRGNQNQLRLGESSVSRMHATILRSRFGITLRDEASKVGTYVNGMRINGPIRLHDGDKIQVGYYLIFEFRER
jgi:serine/threonine protein kinase